MLSPRTLRLYFHTLRHLEQKQILYRIYYALRNRLRILSGFKYPLTIPRCAFLLRLQPSIPSAEILHENGFTFLNQTHAFPGPIDWDFPHFGKLWTYNLNYFDYLQQSQVTPEKGLRLIHAFIHTARNSNTGFEPYPTSLRAINWIKFLSFHRISDNTIDSALYAQYCRLQGNIEYHLLGNHLLENGFALLFGAYFFRDETLYAGARHILFTELEEQILPDGGHFELSPMYHQILLYRLLDAINLVSDNEWKGSELSGLLEEKAGLMLGWLEQMSFQNGEIPLFNDAAFGIAPTSKEIFAYVSRLGLRKRCVSLSESGYRKIAGEHFECVLDVGAVGPDYIPGHAHADALSFVLYVRGRPVIVDTGTSTYENTPLRHFQRSTRAHNTVEIDGCDQSEVWGAFRVARRARVTDIKEWEGGIRASHNGYRRLAGKPIHTREWRFREDALEVHDRIQGHFGEAVSRFHFHPDFDVRLLSEDGSLGQIGGTEGAIASWRIMKGAGRLVAEAFHPEFNVAVSTWCLEVSFTGKETGIEFKW